MTVLPHPPHWNAWFPPGGWYKENSSESSMALTHRLPGNTKGTITTLGVFSFITPAVNPLGAHTDKVVVSNGGWKMK